VGLIDLLSDSAEAGMRVEFLPSGGSWELGRLMDASATAARRLANDHGHDAAVAVAMDSTPAALALFIGACRGGRRVVSVPMAPRRATAAVYADFVEQACRIAGAEVLYVPASRVSSLPDLPVDVDTFEAPSAAAVDHVTVRDDESGAQLVQFTSGSTSDPKGVVLPIERVAVNVRSIIEALELRPGDNTCSWLPLSHDMGLVGMALTALCSGGSRWIDGGTAVLIKPELFVRRPRSWLEACTAFGATVTAAPDFGFAHAARWGHAPTLDLHRLRICITGAEPVRPETLRQFDETFAATGFDSTSFCPAYGMAEAGLAVTMTRPEEHWSSLHVDRDDLAADVVTPLEPSPGSAGRSGRRAGPCKPSTELVAAGRALAGYEVASGAGPDRVGVLAVNGPSLFDGYLGAETDRGPGEPFVTRDAGFIRDGLLYVRGRLDDVVIVAGRNLYLADIDHAAVASGTIGVGRVQAVAHKEGFGVVAEHRGTTEGAMQLAQAIRRGTVAAIGAEPSEVVVVGRGTLPKTPSGKPRRRELVRLIETDELPIVYRATFSR
jgi:acyl-CoA synthetase (AMP-forming)/AMP-acid ligase II